MGTLLRSSPLVLKMGCDHFVRDRRVLVISPVALMPRATLNMRQAGEIFRRESTVHLIDAVKQRLGVIVKFFSVYGNGTKVVGAESPECIVHGRKNRPIAPSFRLFINQRLPAQCQSPPVRHVDQLDYLRDRRTEAHLTRHQSDEVICNSSAVIRAISTTRRGTQCILSGHKARAPGMTSHSSLGAPRSSRQKGTATMPSGSWFRRVGAGEPAVQAEKTGSDGNQPFNGAEGCGPRRRPLAESRRYGAGADWNASIPACPRARPSMRAPPRAFRQRACRRSRR